MPFGYAMLAQILPRDAVLRAWEIRDYRQSVFANTRILPVHERLDCYFIGGNVSLGPAEGVG